MTGAVLILVWLWGQRCSAAARTLASARTPCPLPRRWRSLCVSGLLCSCLGTTFCENELLQSLHARVVHTQKKRKKEQSGKNALSEWDISLSTHTGGIDTLAASPLVNDKAGQDMAHNMH